MSAPKNKQTIIMECIREGGATRESLMEAADVNRAGLASQLAYLNQRGHAMAEVDPTKAEFPLVDNDGEFYFGTLEDYESARAPRKPASRSRKAISVAEVIERAQKREDRASAAFARAEAKLDKDEDNEVFQLEYEIAKYTLDLASLKLSKVQAEDYSYEVGLVDDELASQQAAEAAAEAAGDEVGDEVEG